MQPDYVSVEDVCRWITNNSYTQTLYNITDIPPDYIVQDFLEYVETLNALCVVDLNNLKND